MNKSLHFRHFGIEQAWFLKPGYNGEYFWQGDALPAVFVRDKMIFRGRQQYWRRRKVGQPHFFYCHRWKITPPHQE
ncbi:MAG: hypothetical protein WBB69_03325 [Anaerolineales bacterium]